MKKPITTADDAQPSPSLPPAPILSEERIVLIIAIIAGFLTPFDGSATNIALPFISGEFHMDAVALSWVATAYLLASALFIVPFGKIADIYGRKKVFLAGLSIFTLASLLMTMVPSTPVLIGMRVLQGAGSGMIFGTTVAILTSVVPKQRRGRALGIYITSVYLGLTLGPPLGGLLTQSFGWRSIFLVNVPIGVAAVLLVIWKLKGEWAECPDERFDLTGSLIYAVALVAVMYGFSKLPSAAGGALIVAGLVMISAFVWYEKRTPTPVLDMRLFGESKVFLFSNLAALINYSATFAVTFLLSLDLQYTKGFTPEHAGLILIAQAFMQMLISPLAGQLSDRIEPRVVASIGMGCTALGLGLFGLFLSENTPLWFILSVLVLLGVGAGLFSSPNTNAIMSAVDKRFYGVASGVNGMMRLLGQMLSMGIASMIFAVVIGRVEITPTLYPQFVISVHYAFILFTILCIAGIYASYASGNAH